MPNGKKQPGAAGLPAPVLRASPRRNAIRSTSTTIASTTNLNTTKNAGIATDLVKKLDDRLGSQKQKPTTGAGVGITDIQPQATTSTSTSASTSTSTSTSGGGTRSVLLPSHNPNSNSFGPDTQQGPGEQQRDGARDGNGNGDGDGDGSMEQRRGEDMPLQVQESGSFSSTVIPPTPIKSRPIKGKGKRSGGMGTQKEGSGANREEQMEVSSGEQAGLDLDTDSNSKLKPTSTSSSNSALRTNKDQPGTMGRSFFRSISASHLPPPGSHHHHHHSQQRVGDIDPTLRVPKVVRRGSSGQSSLEGSAAGSRSGSGQISISRAGSASGSTSGGTTRSRSVSQEGSSLGQAYVAPPQPQHSNSGSSSMHSNSNSNAAKQGQIMGQTYSVPMHASHTGGHLQRHAQGQELVMQPLQPQPVRAAKGYVVYPSAEQHSQHHPQQIASGSRPQYWMDPATGKYYEDPGVQEYGYAIGPPVVYATGYPHPQPIPHPQAVQYHQPGYPVQQHYAQVDSRGFVIPDRSLSVSRTSSRSAGPGSGRYRRSEGGEGGEGGEDDTASVHSHSSNSAAFTARILAGMGTTGGSGSGSGSGAKRGEMGDTLKVPGASDGKKGKNKEKKVKEAGTSAKKGKKPVSANTSSTRDDDQDKESDGGTAVPPAWRPDLRPGDTVTDPKYPEAHGCPYCDKVYRGQHARSICRRHQMSKHGIELEVQVKKSRWDNNPNRPANEEEKHRRTLESKRRWAAKDRRRRRAEKLGLPMPESSDEEDYDMRSESGSIAQSVTDTATSKATPSRSGSPHANTLPVKGGRAKRRSGSGLRDVSIPPQPTRRITSQEAVRLAAMERVRLRKAQPDWQDDGSSEEDEGEGDDEAPIQETDIVVDPSPQVPRGHAQNQRVGARQPKSTPTKTSQRQDIAIDPRIHPAFLPAEEQRMLHEHHQPYKSDVQQLQPQADTVVESAVPPVSHKTPIGQLRQPLIQHSKEATKSSATRSGQSRRAAPPPALLRSNEADVFGSGHSSMGSLDLLADTLDRAQPMTPTTGKTMVPGPLQPPIFKTPAPVSKSRSSNVGSKKPNTDRNGPDNNEAAEILLAISASPAPNLRKTPIDDDIGTMDHGNGTAMGGDSMGPRTGDRMMIGRRQLDLENDGDIEMDNLEADSRAAAMNETPSRPSGPRRKPANNATPIRKLPMRSTRTGERPPSDDEFAVPELQSTTNDPSSSVSKRHEDSPITPAELQPAADILPYRRGKPPTYGRKDGGGDRAIIAKSDLSSPPSGLPVTKATPTPKMSTLRSGVTPFQGYRPGALATPARPGHMAGIAGSPADYTTFSSPSGLDLTQKLGLAPAPTVPESPTWLEMVRATPDARQKRARPGSMDSDAGAAPDSPRKRVRV